MTRHCGRVRPHPSEPAVRGKMLRLSVLALLTVMLSACAGTQNRHTDPEGDPWEGFNRNVHAFNMTLDRFLLRPVAVGYDVVMPDPFQRGVGNFFRNLDYPVTLMNQLLQGKLKEGGMSTGRFLVNTTVGLLGVFDVASKMGMPHYREDFGQTLAVWGYDNSRYLVLPVFGPSTFRDGIGRSIYGYAHPVSWAAREHNNYVPMVVDVVQTRARFLADDQQLLDAYDPYVLIRDVFLQNRLYKIHDGNPPQTDYDLYLIDEE
jgi:phospholipid-binding lipoprotein MlaA